MKYNILIPAYKPDRNLIQAVTVLTDHLKDLGRPSEIIIVNDGSPWEYEEVFSEAESMATVLTHETNKGKGAALKTGMAYISRQTGPSVTVTADADGQHLPLDILNCLMAAESAPDSLILGVLQIIFSRKDKARS